MLGLYENAVLYRKLGQHGGMPIYADDGTPFRCRTQPEDRQSASGETIERTADTRIFALPIGAAPGDRIECDGRKFTVVEVQRMRGLRAVHHVELLAREEFGA